MLCAAWPDVRGDLASTRQGASAFLDNLEEINGVIGGQNWVAVWTKIGDVHCITADLNIQKGAFDKAAEAWLCALTAFEVARRLADENDPHCGDISTKVEAAVQRFGSLERVQIACSDQSEFPAYYLPVGGPDSCTPAVICISSEEETAATLLGRLLPVAIGRGMSLLVISHDDISNHRRGQSELFLSCCLEYLSLRPDVDATRIGVFGDGLSAVLATDFAAFDRRVASAVCDGGLWGWARTLASVGWMTRTAVNEDLASARRSRLVRQLKCPVLVVAGGRGAVSVPEAIKLQAHCTAARIDLELKMPRVARTPLREIENFVTSDNCIFGWLEHKLARASAP